MGFIKIDQITIPLETKDGFDVVLKKAWKNMQYQLQIRLEEANYAMKQADFGSELSKQKYAEQQVFLVLQRVLSTAEINTED